MKVAWVYTAGVIALYCLVSVNADAKKYDSDLHKLKKVDQVKKVEEVSQDSEAKAVSDLSNLQRLAALNAAERQGPLVSIHD